MNALKHLRKVRAMPLAEIVHRVRQRAFLRRERRQHAQGRLGGLHALEVGLVPGLQGDGWKRRLLDARATSARHYFPSVRQRGEMQRLMVNTYVEEAAESRRQAAAARSHRISFFGSEFEYGEIVDWHADPVSWRRWPRVYHADVPLGGDRGFGDVKFVWETNRHQFFVDLAKAAFLDASPADATELQALHRSWMDDVPYGTGVLWASALEPAFRVFSWLWAYHLLVASGFMEPDDHLRWLAGFRDHGHFLKRHLEHWTSPYNHLAGEASALYQLGLLFPEFGEAADWRNTGRAVLEGTLSSQFHSDGGSVEQSTFYHHATLGFYLLAALLGRLNGEEFGAPVWKAMERALEFSLHLRWPDGFTPTIGGGDDGKPVRMEHLPLWDFRHLLAVGAVLFGRPDFKHGASRFWEDALWLLGADGLERFQAMPAWQPETRRLFRESGYGIFRSDWSAKADFVCFDCGPQAGGLRRDEVPSAAHGHADCLSVIVALGGHRVLVDPGFYCYNCPDGWEVHFRKTHVHNTLAVDGRDQARHVSKMAWSNTYQAEWDAVSIEAEIPGVAGHHDGFRHAPHPHVHRRYLWLPGPGRVVLADVLEGHEPASFTLNFQFAPGELQQIGPRVVRFDGRFDVAWSIRQDCTVSADSGGPLPDGGWIAPSLGVRRPAPRLRISGRTGPESTLLISVVVDTHRVPDGTSHLAELDQAIQAADWGSDGVGSWLPELLVRWSR